MRRFCGARWWLRVDTGTSSEQASWDHPRIIQHEKFVASQQTGEIRERAILENSRRTIQE